MQICESITRAQDIASAEFQLCVIVWLHGTAVVAMCGSRKTHSHRAKMSVPLAEFRWIIFVDQY